MKYKLSQHSGTHLLQAQATCCRAFTLIEILVVVAIIALLISILLPSMAAARESGRRTLCGTQLGEMSKGLSMYYSENKDVLPGPIHQGLELETVDKTVAYDDESWHLPSFIRKYFSDRSRGKQLTDQVIKCPTADKMGSSKFTFNKTDAVRPFTYAVNNWYASKTHVPERPGTDPAQYFGWPNTFWTNGEPVNGRFLASPNAPEYSKPKKISRIRQHGREWAIGDAFRYNDATRPPLFTSIRRHGDWRIGTYQSSWMDDQQRPLPTAPYHDKGLNVAMFDGHAEYQRNWTGSVNAPR